MKSGGAARLRDKHDVPIDQLPGRGSSIPRVMINSNANTGDRPVRRHFNKIVVATLTFTVIAILLGMWVISAKKPSLGSSGANPASRSSAPADEHPQ